MPRTLTRSELSQLADSLATVLAAVRAGDLGASTAMTYPIEGAVVALKGVLGGSTDQLLERLTGSVVIANDPPPSRPLRTLTAGTPSSVSCHPCAEASASSGLRIVLAPSFWTT